MDPVLLTGLVNTLARALAPSLVGIAAVIWLGAPFARAWAARIADAPRPASALPDAAALDAVLDRLDRLERSLRRLQDAASDAPTRLLRSD